MVLITWTSRKASVSRYKHDNSYYFLLGRCTVYNCHSTLPAGTHTRFLKLPSLPNESASHFFGQSLWAHREGRVYECKPCFAKLEKGCKMIHAIQQIVRELHSCCMFLWGDNCVSWHWKAFTTSTTQRKKSLLKLSPQPSVHSLIKSKAKTGKQSFAFAHRSLIMQVISVRHVIIDSIAISLVLTTFR